MSRAVSCWLSGVRLPATRRLISALESCRTTSSRAPATRATTQMWIEQPLDRDQEKKGTKGSWLNRAFDTHPPLDERIAALKAM
jgi:heat shock protein HtpX